MATAFVHLVLLILNKSILEELDLFEDRESNRVLVAPCSALISLSKNRH